MNAPKPDPHPDPRFDRIEAGWRRAHAEAPTPMPAADFDARVMAAVRATSRPAEVPVLRLVWRFAAAACITATLTLSTLVLANDFDMHSLSAVLAWDMGADIYGDLLLIF